MIMELGHHLQIEEPEKGKIEVFFTSHDQRNDYSTWQNSTMLMVIKDSKGKRLWTGEYNYKGGVEMSGFSVLPCEFHTPILTSGIYLERLP